MDNLKDNVGNTTHYLCPKEGCDVVYYNLDTNTTFDVNQVKVPIWYKNDASPKYICYCNQVTEKQIIDAVVNKDAKSIKDVLKLTGAMKNANCEINNPTGKCCSSVIQSTINKALQIKCSHI